MSVKVGVIGIGNQGGTHFTTMAKGVCPDLEVVAVADINPARLEWAKEQCPTIQCFDDAIAMLDSGLIEACVIAVPHYYHPPYAIECMKRGIHVMVEKPAGVYTKQVREMNAVADEHPDIVFGMMFNVRTVEVFQRLRELVKSGNYGEIRRVNWIITDWYRPQAYYDSGDWRATWSGEGGGVLMNQCPHQFDLLQWICGVPVKVQSFVHYGKWHDIEVEDDATAYMEFANGATGVFVTSTGDAVGTNRLEIQMDKARFIAEGNTIRIDEYEMSEPEFSATNTQPFGDIPFTTKTLVCDKPATYHIAVLNAWGDAILRGGKLMADGREGINSAMIANAIQLSAFLNQPVELPFDDDLFYNELMKRVATSRRKENVKQVFTDTSKTFSGADKK